MNHGDRLNWLAEALRDELDRRDAAILAEIDRRLEQFEQLEHDDEVLKVKEVCQRYRFSRSTWDTWLADTRSGLENVIFRVGREIRIPKTEFEAWLAKRRGTGLAS